jgi:hypothetical protein
MADRYEDIILLIFLTVKDGSFVRESGRLEKVHNIFMLVIGDPLVVKKPCSFHIRLLEWMATVCVF